jgi:archaellum component FlaF (FlaF/FlaG flagellin family)
MNRARISGWSMAFAMGLAILSGCESDRMSNIPTNATIASSGDDRLSYTASTDGTIWVYDVSNDRIDYSGPIAMNESVTVDPHTKTVTVNGRVVSDKLDGSAKHRVYFVPGTGMTPTP